MPLGSQWCCSAASACMGRHKACVALTTPSCCCESCLLIRSGSAMLYGVPLEMALISSSPGVTVLSAKGSSSYFSRYSSISSVQLFTAFELAYLKLYEP